MNLPGPEAAGKRGAYALLMAGCAALAACHRAGPSGIAVAYLTVHRNVRIQDLTGSGVQNFMDWAKASPEVVARSGLVEFRMGTDEIQKEIMPDLDRSERRKECRLFLIHEAKDKERRQTADGFTVHCRDPQFNEPWVSMQENKGMRIVQMPERPTPHYRLTKQKAIETLRRIQVAIDGKDIELAETAVLHDDLYAFVLLEVGRHDLRVSEGTRISAKEFAVPVEQQHLIPVHAKSLSTKDISVAIQLGPGPEASVFAPFMDTYTFLGHRHFILSPFNMHFYLPICHSCP